MKKNFSNLEIRDQDRWEYEGNELIENAAIELKDVQVQAFLPSDESVNSFMQGNLASCVGVLIETIYMQLRFAPRIKLPAMVRIIPMMMMARI